MLHGAGLNPHHLSKEKQGNSADLCSFLQYELFHSMSQHSAGLKLDIKRLHTT